MQSNPLQQYFRVEKMFITLPSGADFYSPDVVKYTSSGEVGIRSMTARDELMFKNPDMLFNGETIRNIIVSCVPSVLDVDQLLTIDIDAIMVAIRQVSFGNEYVRDYVCPKCGKEHAYAADLNHLLGNMSYFNGPTTVDTSDGISIKVAPLAFKDTASLLKSNFSRQQALRIIEQSNVSDAEKLVKFKEQFDELVNLKIDSVAASVRSITHLPSGTEITERSQIIDFLNNTDLNVVESITHSLAQLAKIGVNRSIPIECVNEECKHTWEEDIDFNPMSFFIKS